MAKDRLLSDNEIKAILKEKAEEIVGKAKTYIDTAINAFYGDYTPHYYNRVPGFSNLANFSFDSVAEETSSGYLLTFSFDAGDVAVNDFVMKIGDKEIVRPSSPEWAFDSGFVHGYHGGPKFPPHHSMGGIWTMFVNLMDGLE